MTKNPSNPDDNDEVLTFLARMERLLIRVIEGIGVYFFRLPEWLYRILNEYLGWFGRVIFRALRVGLLVGVLLGILIGLPVLVGQVTPLFGIILFVLEVFAVFWSLRRYQAKERERKQKVSKHSSAFRLVCALCKTEPVESSPVECKFCGEPWEGIPG